VQTAPLSADLGGNLGITVGSDTRSFGVTFNSQSAFAVDHVISLGQPIFIESQLSAFAYQSSFNGSSGGASSNIQFFL
jgi:hypothetical protein